MNLDFSTIKRPDGYKGYTQYGGIFEQIELLDKTTDRLPIDAINFIGNHLLSNDKCKKFPLFYYEIREGVNENTLEIWREHRGKSDISELVGYYDINKTKIF